MLPPWDVRLLLPIAISLAACGGGPELGADAGPDAAPVAQGSPASAPLVVNELSPRPVSGGDWVELVNRSDAPIDLGDYYLTDNPDRLDHYLRLDGTVDPGALVVVEPGGVAAIARVGARVGTGVALAGDGGAAGQGQQSHPGVHVALRGGFRSTRSPEPPAGARGGACSAG